MELVCGDSYRVYSRDIAKKSEGEAVSLEGLDSELARKDHSLILWTKQDIGTFTPLPENQRRFYIMLPTGSGSCLMKVSVILSNESQMHIFRAYILGIKFSH